MQNVFVALRWGKGLFNQDPASRSMRGWVPGRCDHIRKNVSSQVMGETQTQLG